MQLVVTEVKKHIVQGRNRSAQTRIYLWKNKQSIGDNLLSRGREPVALYRRDLLPAISSQVPEVAGNNWTWSSKAGCSCGCSPGFIVKSTVGFELHVRFDVVGSEGKGRNQ